MAGQARRGTRGQARSSRADSSWSAPVAASVAASGSATVTMTSAPISTSTSAPGSTDELRTRATYRNLIIRGLSPDEAANLTAWMAGIDVGETHWTLRQVNQLLFL